MAAGFSRFLIELRRRRVLPTALGYVLVGLGLIEGTDILSSRLIIPAWAVDFLFWIVVLGFPAALILSWFFDFSSEGIRRTLPMSEEERAAGDAGTVGSGTWALVGVGAVVVLAAGWLALSRAGRPAEQATGQELVSATVTDAPRGLAVLPFRNLGPRETDAFVDGIVAELWDKLAMVEDLRVLSRTSSDTYRDSDKGLRKIGEELGVEFLLEGDVQRESFPSGPDRVRIYVRLFRAEDEELVWRHTFERDVTGGGVFVLQRNIAESVAEQAGVRMGEEVRALWVVPPTENPDAHDLWMEARYVRRDGWIEESSLRALSLLQQAVELDPDFWWAWADISGVKSFMGRDGASPALCQDAQEALERASALAGGDPTIHYFQAWYLYRCPNDYEGAMEEVELVRTAMPGHYYRLLSAIYGRQGKRDARLQAMLHAFTWIPGAPAAPTSSP